MLFRHSILLIFTLAASSLAAQTVPAFDKSMLITNDDRGKTLKVNGVLRVESDKVVFWGKKEGEMFSTPYADVTKLATSAPRSPATAPGSCSPGRCCSPRRSSTTSPSSPRASTPS